MPKNLISFDVDLIWKNYLKFEWRNTKIEFLRFFLNFENKGPGIKPQKLGQRLFLNQVAPWERI